MIISFHTDTGTIDPQHQTYDLDRLCLVHLIQLLYIDINFNYIIYGIYILHYSNSFIY